MAGKREPKMVRNVYAKFVARTVLVKNGQVDDAMKLLNRLLGQEGFLEQYRRTRYYEKPSQFRRRINFEKCKAIHNEDMDRKLQFLMRKNRLTPWVGCE
ncbi:28S ribosomal protein S21, mitochondrial-like isoform X2 [Amphibalanus amphitrite]|uniref:28S ribosomal protein S21, mitochondrial-like isoform X2 n=1 Tax=Amphibalanus amphitrite TaxID=1232801 RepID=UPI001C909788|nr:28S ribosomal protein S21, mitochondrial-like isoform X2 [Amphibalanus amphitrite]